MEEVEELKKRIETFERMMPDKRRKCSFNVYNEKEIATNRIEKLRDDLLMLLTEIRERDDVDESVISLMFRAISEEGPVLPEEEFKIFNKETGNREAVMKGLLIFTNEHKGRNRVYIRGCLVKHNSTDNQRKKKRSSKTKERVFKGNQVKITKKE